MSRKGLRELAGCASTRCCDAKVKKTGTTSGRRLPQDTGLTRLASAYVSGLFKRFQGLTPSVNQ